MADCGLRELRGVQLFRSLDHARGNELELESGEVA